MNKLLLAVSIPFSALAMTSAASAHARCDGDFELVHGSWVSTPYCQELVANRMARREHKRVAEHSSRSTETPDEFCRWHVGEIETETYCSSYND